MQAEIDLYLFLGVRCSPLLLVKVRQRNVRLRVFVVETYCCQLFLYRSVELTPLLQHVAQVVVCRRKLRIESESFAQVGFRLLRVAHKLLRYGEIQIRPRGGTQELPVQFDGAVDGAWPEAGVVIGKNGTLYGTAYAEGGDQWGTVFAVAK